MTSIINIDITTVNWEIFIKIFSYGLLPYENKTRTFFSNEIFLHENLEQSVQDTRGRS